MVELVWVGFYWGRYNIGAIEFSLPPLILDDFGALFHVIARKSSIPYWELNDFHDLADNDTLKNKSARAIWKIPRPLSG